jgi:hypothetical protein
MTKREQAFVRARKAARLEEARDDEESADFVRLA